MNGRSVALIGLLSWDRFFVVDDYPSPGSYAIVRATLEAPGGTTGNTAAALARLGLPVSVAAVVGDDGEGEVLRRSLAEAGCDVRAVVARPGVPSDYGLLIVSGRGESRERTIFWRQGARLRYGDPLPIAELFAHDLVVLDVDDPRLRQLIVDLPIHVAPRTVILGTMTYLPEMAPGRALAAAVRHDYLVGNERELCYLTQRPSFAAATAVLQAAMAMDQLRLAFITRGAAGCVVVSENTTWEIPAFPVEVVDTTGAGDAFAAGVALGLLERRQPDEVGRFGAAAGALAVRELGARAALPSRAELDALLEAT